MTMENIKILERGKSTKKKEFTQKKKYIKIYKQLIINALQNNIDKQTKLENK